MRIAVPLDEGRLSQHFGHSKQFLFVDADLEQKQVLGKKVETAPEHAPGVLPKWLAEHGVNVVIASGMGVHARDLLDGQFDAGADRRIGHRSGSVGHRLHQR